MRSTWHIGVLIAIGISILMLWTMLLPDYILSLDLVFTPHFYIPSNGDGFLNSAPLWYAIHFLYSVLPGWAVEKLMLFALFFLISFLSFTFLPVPNRFYTRLFASLLYTANTFVYVRMLAGQWTILYAYALLPLFICTLFRCTRHASYKAELALGAVLALIAIFLLHYFALCVLIILVVFGIYKSKLLAHLDWKDLRTFTTHGLVAVASMLACTSYWTIPALIQHHSVLSSFTASHWEAFAAVGHGRIPVLLNLAMLGGFWGEAHPWATYFIWPQVQPIFWIAFGCVLALCALGVLTLWSERRSKALFFILLGVASLVLATGAATTPFVPINLFLYEHLPFWSGLRDSQKIIAFLALSYAVLGGYGFSAVVEYVEHKRAAFAPYVIALLFLIPLAFGMYVWGGFSKQLPNAQFPTSWERARGELLAHPEAQALILPWQGYFSLEFDRNLIVANPAGQYFGPQAVVSQNVRLGQVYDQSGDPAYEELDAAITQNSAPHGESVATFLKDRGIHYVIYFQDLQGSDNFTYNFLQSPDFTPLWATKGLIFYEIH